MPCGGMVLNPFLLILIPLQAIWTLKRLNLQLPPKQLQFYLSTYMDNHVESKKYILKCVEVYRKVLNEEAKVEVCHAGLECSIIGGVYPKMDLVSFGPTLRSPHTPDERCNIPSVAKFWPFLKALLEEI